MLGLRSVARAAPVALFQSTIDRVSHARAQDAPHERSVIPNRDLGVVHRRFGGRIRTDGSSVRGSRAHQPRV